MKKKTLFIILISLIIAGGLIAVIIGGRGKFSEEKEHEKPVQVPSRISKGVDGAEVHLSAADMKAAAIEIRPLAMIAHTIDHPAFAEVLDISTLMTELTHYQRLTADVAKSEVALNVARQVADRSRRLHNDDRNISDQALEAAEATLGSEMTNHTALITERDSTLNNLRLNWGQSLISGINQKNSPLASLVLGNASLVRVSLEPTASASTVPTTITLNTPEGIRTAQVLGSAPHADERLQGQALLAISKSYLSIGLKLAAQWPQGNAQNGVLIPSSAVVWWQGMPWIYRQVSSGHFLREPLHDPQIVHDGWFVRDSLAAGTPVVVQGTQLLLSEEQRGEIQVGEDGDK